MDELLAEVAEGVAAVLGSGLCQQLPVSVHRNLDVAQVRVLAQRLLDPASQAAGDLAGVSGGGRVWWEEKRSKCRAAECMQVLKLRTVKLGEKKKCAALPAHSPRTFAALLGFFCTYSCSFPILRAVPEEMGSSNAGAGPKLLPNTSGTNWL